MNQFKVVRFDKIGSSTALGAGVVFLCIVLTFGITQLSFGQDCVVLSVGDYQGMPGEEVQVGVDISDVTGLEVESAYLSLTYAGTILGVQDVTLDGTIADGAFFAWNATELQNGEWQVEISIASGTFLEGAGQLALLTYLVAVDAGPGDTTPLALDGFLNEGNPCVALDSGSFTVGIPSGTEELGVEQLGRLRILGNPVRDEIRFRLEGDSPDPITVQVFAVSGRRVASFTLDPLSVVQGMAIGVPVENLPSGAYMISAVAPGVRERATVLVLK